MRYRGGVQRYSFKIINQMLEENRNNSHELCQKDNFISEKKISAGERNQKGLFIQEETRLRWKVIT